MKVLIVLSVVLAAAVAAKSAHPLLPSVLVEDMQGRITNGELASVGQFPYQVGLHLNVGGKTGFCGGTLISDRYILTAAHCAQPADSIKVILGATKILDSSEPNQQSIHIQKSNMIVHEDYDSAAIKNDIALLKSPVKIPFNKYIQPAALPKKQADGKYATYLDQTVIASGWGKDSDEAQSVTEELRWLEAPVIAKSTCTRYYFGMINDNMICISGKNGRSTCNGDSGGPLVIQENGENVVIGATSFGIVLGCEKGWPGVFTRVSAYLDWIHEHSGIEIN